MAVQLGHFIFENAGTGCLLSKYCNQGLDLPLTESASRIAFDGNFPNDAFCGEFLSTWVESISPEDVESARLIITRKRDASGNPLEDMYTLDWQDLQNPNNHYYHGEGMLYRDVLVGGYR